MTTISSPKSDSCRPSLEIRVPPNVYPLEHPKTQRGITLLQQLIDLAATVGDSLDRVQSDLPDSNCCTCVLRNLQEPVNKYSHALAERYELDQVSRHAPANLTDAAAFASIKARLNRELRTHVSLIEASLKHYGEGLDIGRLFSADVDLLVRIGVDVDHLMHLVLDAYDRPELKVCHLCGNETDDLTPENVVRSWKPEADTGPAGRLARMASERLQSPRASVGGLRLASSRAIGSARVPSRIPSRGTRS